MEVIELSVALLRRTSEMDHQDQDVYVALARDEVSKGVFVIPNTHFLHAELRKTLEKSYSTTSTGPVPALRKEKERDSLFTQIANFALFKTPTSSLPTHLYHIKAILAVEAVKVERQIKAKRFEPADKARDRLNDFLRANGEPNFPFESIVEYPDPDEGSKTLKIHTRGEIDTLWERKPEVWERVLELFDEFAQEAGMVDGYFKKAE